MNSQGSPNDVVATNVTNSPDVRSILLARSTPCHPCNMRNPWTTGLVIALAATASVGMAVGCSSSSGDDSSAAQDSGAGDSSTSGSDGGSGSETGTGTQNEAGPIEAGTSGYGAACAGPAGSTGGCTDAVYNTCELDGPSLICTKTCTYPGGGGPQADPTDCSNPPTTGDCTPKGFCK
jgi:hypothetical protein